MTPQKRKKALLRIADDLTALRLKTEDISRVDEELHLDENGKAVGITFRVHFNIAIPERTYDILLTKEET